MTKHTRPGAAAVSGLALALLFTCASCATPTGKASARNDWYRNSTVIVHCDNHSGLLGKGQSIEDLMTMFATVPCQMIQVSAQSTGYATYPTKVGLNHPQAEGYDTLATFKEVTRRLKRKFCIYMSSCLRREEVKEHPEWQRIGADGKPAPTTGGNLCQRPSPEQKGYLYERFLPQIHEIIEKYDPDGFWFDGDYTIPQPCWCERCLKAWKDKTGLDAPRDATSPHWKGWADWHYAQYQEYRRVVADAIHSASPKALYTSNWSWAWTAEPVPDFADTLSGDEWNIRQVVCATARWGAQQKTPWDMMSYATPEGRSLSRQYSLQRTLQEGALTMARGGVWFAWTFATTITPSGIETTRAMAHFAEDRKPAIGPSLSLSQVAVLDSETSLKHGGESGIDSQTCSVARDLLEARYLTDIVNEETYRAHLTPYHVVILPAQRYIAPETLAELKRFAEDGGLLVVTGPSLLGEGDQEPAEGASLLGIKRSGEEAKKPMSLDLGRKYFVMGARAVETTDAEVLAQFTDGRPALTRRAVGTGAVAYLNVGRLLYPDDGLMGAVLRKLGAGPSYTANSDAPVLCTLRGKPGMVVLHLCDLGARVNGSPADVDTVAYTDWNPPVTGLEVALPMPKEPTRVRAVPPLTTFKATYANGLLHIKVDRFQTHAAILMETDAAPPFPMLLPETPCLTALFHPETERGGILLSDDFEGARSGAKPEGGWSAETRGETAIVATEEAAAKGRRSLRFADAANSSFWPFLHRSVAPFTRGKARLSFDLRVEPGAVCLVELRNEGKGAGPSVRFDGDSNVAAGGKSLTRVALKTWFHVEIEFGLGVEKPSYLVRVEAPGQPPAEVKDLPYASEWFFLCNSVYFIGSGDTPGVFYLDNVVLERW